MARILPVALLLASLQTGLADSHQKPILTAASADYGPSEQHAIANAPHVFNAVHSAMKQWVCALLPRVSSCEILTLLIGLIIAAQWHVFFPCYNTC